MTDFVDPLSVEPGQILNCAQRRNLRLAVRGVIFAAAVFAAGHSAAQNQIDSFRTGVAMDTTGARHPLIDPWLTKKDDPKTDDSGGSCSISGCIVWADPFPLGAGGGAGGGSSGGDGTTGTHDDGSAGPPPPAIPIHLLPDLEKVKCAVTQYGAPGMNDIKFPITENNVFAFVNTATGNYAYSYYASTPPAGYIVVGGDTQLNDPISGAYYPGGGWTEIYANGLQPYSGSFEYRNITTGAVDSFYGPYSTIEIAIFVAAHEVAHQNGLATSSFVFVRGFAGEQLANGYGVRALNAYRLDHGSKCK